MKKILLLLLLISTIASSKSLDSLQNCKEVQVIGLNTLQSEPVTLSVINCDSIKQLDQGSDPFFIINRLSPNTLSQSDNGSGLGYSYMKIRGLDQTRINFTLNGIPLNEMEDQGIYFSNMPGFYSNIDKIQIQRGIGISKYGTTAIAGSVNMESKSSLQKKTNLEVGYGSFETTKGLLHYSSGKINKSNIATSSQISYSSTSGFKKHSGSEGFNYFGEVGYFGNKNTIKLYGFLGTSLNHLAFYPVSKHDIDTFGYNYNTNNLRDTDKFNQNFVALNWVNYQKKNVKFNTSLYTNGVNGKYNIGIDSLNYTFGVDGRQSGILSNLVYEKNNFVINTGLNYNYYQRLHSGPEYQNTGYKQDYIAYTKLIYPINKLRLFGDFQIRKVDFLYKGSFQKDFNWVFLNPKFGIKYIGNNFENYVSLGKTNREPARSDIFLGYDNPDTSNVNYLLPEKVYDLEVGTIYHKQNLILSANIYVMKFYNEYVPTGQIDPFSGLMIKKSFTNSLRTGIEADMSYSISKFILSTNASISKSKVYTDYLSNQTYIFKDQITPYGSPNFLMNNFVNYNIKSNKIIKNISIGLNGQYLSKIYLDNTQSENLSSPSYYIINQTTAISFDGFSLSLNLNNLFNEKYYLPGGTYQNNPTYYTGSSRSFFITLRIFE